MTLKSSIKSKFLFNEIPSRILKNQNGASAVLVAIVLAMLLGFTALAVDVGYMYSTRNELQNVADAAALAATGKLGDIYLNLIYSEQQNYDASGDKGAINQAAIDVAALNKGAGKYIIIDPNDIIISHWNWDLGPDQNLTEDLIEPDAVRVIARRAAGINDAVTTFFGQIFVFFGGSADTFEVSAVAAAALSGLSTVEDGELITPVGISESFFDNPDPCLTLIEFSPTADSCAGWHNFFDNINASAVAKKLISFIEAYEYIGTIDDVEYTGTGEGQQWLSDHFDIAGTVTPEVTEGSQDPTIFEFQGGAIASLFLGGYYAGWELDGDDGVGDNPIGPVLNNEKKPAPFINLFDFFRFRDNDDVNGTDVDIDTCNGLMHPDQVWTATVPVYDDGGECDNPNDAIEIIGYAKIQILMPNPPPSTNILACVDCELSVIEGRGGGGNFGGVKGSIPNLVQ